MLESQHFHRRHHEKTSRATSPRPIFPEFAELFAGFPSWASVRPVVDNDIIRLEDEVKDGTYEVRAEIPGVDAAKDVDITVREGA
jgi:HSP20 family protein